MALEYDLLRFVPITHFLGGLEVRRISTVQILEDAILIFETSILPLRGALLNRRKTAGLLLCAGRCGCHNPRKGLGRGLCRCCCPRQHVERDVVRVGGVGVPIGRGVAIVVG